MCEVRWRLEMEIERGANVSCGELRLCRIGHAWRREGEGWNVDIDAAEIRITELDPGRPLRQESPFNAAARGPAGQGVAARRDERTHARPSHDAGGRGIRKYNASGGI